MQSPRPAPWPSASEHRTFVRIEPAVLLPTQATAPRRDLTLPVQRLMVAVLEEAVSTYQRNAVAHSERARRELAEAEHWIESDDLTWPFSCASICLALGLDVGRLRARLRRWREVRRRPAAAAGSRAGTAYVSPFRRTAGSRNRITTPRHPRPPTRPRHARERAR